jgi:hypothetical protein
VSRSPRYDVTLTVVVTDRRLLIKTARDRAERDGAKRGLIKDTRGAVHYLLDPGSCPAEGWEIESSEIESFGNE